MNNRVRLPQSSAAFKPELSLIELATDFSPALRF